MIDRHEAGAFGFLLAVLGAGLYFMLVAAVLTITALGILVLAALFSLRHAAALLGLCSPPPWRDTAHDLLERLRA